MRANGWLGAIPHCDKVTANGAIQQCVRRRIHLAIGHLGLQSSSCQMIGDPSARAALEQ